MNLSNANFFGPEKFTIRLVEYPPYSSDIECIRYGYESKGFLYDVVIPSRPIHTQDDKQVTRYYKTNGVSTLDKSPMHAAIEAHFNL